jgi:hypothetical protein
MLTYRPRNPHTDILSLSVACGGNGRDLLGIECDLATRLWHEGTMLILQLLSLASFYRIFLSCVDDRRAGDIQLLTEV